MTQEFKSMLDVALTLSEPERAELAEILIASIAGTSRSDIEDAWIAEAKRRDQAANDVYTIYSDHVRPCGDAFEPTPRLLETA